MSDQIKQLLSRFESLADPKYLKGLERVGVETGKAYGVRIPELRKIAKELGTDHQLALDLWDTGNHEARILASMVDDPAQVSEEQMEAWVKDFNSWDLCDQVTGNLFDKTEIGFTKAIEWTAREEEFVKRAGFTIFGWAAFHIKDAEDKVFKDFMPIIIREATDPRNFVKKGVNYALRNIGKRNLSLHAKALETAREIEKIDDKTAQWIAKDAIKELESEKIIERLKKKEKRK